MLGEHKCSPNVILGKNTIINGLKLPYAYLHWVLVHQ